MTGLLRAVRRVGELVGVSKSPVNRIVNKMTKFKNAQTTRDAATRRLGRMRIASSIPQVCAGGMRAKRNSWPDGTWSGHDTCKQFNS